jgi:hypothetical protein
MGTARNRTVSGLPARARPRPLTAGPAGDCEMHRVGGPTARRLGVASFNASTFWGKSRGYISASHTYMASTAPDIFFLCPAGRTQFCFTEPNLGFALAVPLKQLSRLALCVRAAGSLAAVKDASPRRDGHGGAGGRRGGRRCGDACAPPLPPAFRAVLPLRRPGPPACERVAPARSPPL